MTPAELLDTFPALTVGQTAEVLNLRHGDGRPNRELVRALIRKGKLRLVDDDQPVTRWTISSSELRRYLGVGVA